MTKPLILLTALFWFSNISFCQDTASISYSIIFTAYKSHLTKEIRSTLDRVSNDLKKGSNYCYIISCYRGENEKRNVTDMDRLKRVSNYLVKTGEVDQNRIYFTYGSGCKEHEFMLAVSRQQPATPLPPHPALRKKKGNKQ